MDWNEFLKDVVQGTTTIIQSVKSPTGSTRTTLAVPQPGVSTRTAAAGNGNMLGLVVIALLFFAIVKA